MSGRKEIVYSGTEGQGLLYITNQVNRVTPTDSCHWHEIGGKKATDGGGSGDLFGVVHLRVPWSNSREEESRV
jgi:hypothetical protein